MPLKLLQSDQAEKINNIPSGSSCVIQGESDRKQMYREIIHRQYTHGKVYDSYDMQCVEIEQG
jgi:hypothetical protein